MAQLQGPGEEEEEEQHRKSHPESKGRVSLPPQLGFQWLVLRGFYSPGGGVEVPSPWEGGRRRRGRALLQIKAAAPLQGDRLGGRERGGGELEEPGGPSHQLSLALRGPSVDCPTLAL